MNKVFIATSLDGYIADKNGGLDWLHSTPNPDSIDMGYGAFTDSIDALIMGRTTFETVISFDIDWPYTKPVFVLSNTLKEIPKELSDKVFIIKGELKNVIKEIHQKGYENLYIDGGKTVQSFLKEDLIDEMIITIIPLLLGNGFSLFGNQENQLDFKCVKTEIFLNKVVQNHFVRIR